MRSNVIGQAFTTVGSETVISNAIMTARMHMEFGVLHSADLCSINQAERSSLTGACRQGGSEAAGDMRGAGGESNHGAPPAAVQGPAGRQAQAWGWLRRRGG